MPKYCGELYKLYSIPRDLAQERFVRAVNAGEYWKAADIFLIFSTHINCYAVKSSITTLCDNYDMVDIMYDTKKIEIDDRTFTNMMKRYGVTRGLIHLYWEKKGEMCDIDELLSYYEYPEYSIHILELEKYTPDILNMFMRNGISVIIFTRALHQMSDYHRSKLLDFYRLVIDYAAQHEGTYCDMVQGRETTSVQLWPEGGAYSRNLYHHPPSSGALSEVLPELQNYESYTIPGCGRNVRISYYPGDGDNLMGLLEVLGILLRNWYVAYIPSDDAGFSDITGPMYLGKIMECYIDNMPDMTSTKSARKV